MGNKGTSVCRFLRDYEWSHMSVRYTEEEAELFVSQVRYSPLQANLLLGILTVQSVFAECDDLSWRRKLHVRL